MIFIQLLALAILLHESSGACRFGLPFLYRNIAPSLGLRLPQWMIASVHILLCLTCLALLAVPNAWPLYFLLLGTMLTAAATQPLRMSNHVMISCFLTLLLCVDTLLISAQSRGGPPGALLRAGCVVLVITTYWVAFFHKLNREYLSTERSCAWRLSKMFWLDRGVKDGWLPRLSGLYGLWGTLVLEGLLPIFLLLPETRHAALAIALIFHFSLAFLSVIHFSACMYAALVCFLPLEAVDEALATAMYTLSWIDVSVALMLMVIVVEFSPHRSFHHRRLIRLPQLAFALVSAAAVSTAMRLDLSAIGGPLPFNQLGAAQTWALWMIGGLFAINGLAPYLGLKTEFSLAMFSNLKHQPWCHIVMPKPLRPFHGARYVEIEHLDGLPLPEDLPVGSARRTAVDYLAKWRTQKFSSYFFYQALDQLHDAGPLADGIQIRWRENGKLQELDNLSALPSLPRPTGGNLFPFMMARDENRPHCY